MTSMTSAPVSFMEALKERYGAAADEGASPLVVQDKKWQFVGAEQATKVQSQYDRLGLVVLRDCGITCAVSPVAGDAINELQEANMVRLTDLDLSANVSLTLSEVGKMVPYFPRLSTLQLCDIPTLLCPPQASFASASSFTTPSPLLVSAQLTKLVLNNTGFTNLAQLRSLVAVPVLRELHLDANHLTSLEVVGSEREAASVAAAGAGSAIAFPHVTTLSLAHNALSDWRAIGRAITHVFPALTQLFLTDNQLEDLTLPDDLIARAAAGEAPTAAEEKDILQPYRYLQPLTLLCVKDNATLVRPATVDALRLLCPALTTFRITYSTLLPTWNETNSRMYVVAALPTITLLNRGTVRPKERLDSELLYVQRGLQQRARMTELSKTDAGASAGSSEEVPYPLVDVLAAKHHDVVLSIQREGDTATSTGLNYIMLNVTLHFVNGYAAATTTAASSPQSSQAQKLPSSLTVAKLKALVQKIFQVKPVNQRLSFRSGDHGVLETQTPLDNEQETLGYYGVPDGAILYVEDASLRS